MHNSNNFYKNRELIVYIQYFRDFFVAYFSLYSYCGAVFGENSVVKQAFSFL